MLKIKIVTWLLMVCITFSFVFRVVFGRFTSSSLHMAALPEQIFPANIAGFRMAHLARFSRWADSELSLRAIFRVLSRIHLQFFASQVDVDVENSLRKKADEAKSSSHVSSISNRSYLEVLRRLSFLHPYGHFTETVIIP